MASESLSALVRNIADFPIPGIQFKDITTLLRDGPAFRQTIDSLVARYEGRPIDAVIGIESRGFIFSAPVAYRLGVGLVPIRKPGKLPAATYQVEYDLEYGSNKLELHRDALQPGNRVLIVDDLLATGGTIGAACDLVAQAGAVVEELAFLIELGFLDGRKRLDGVAPIFSLIRY
jgi:adenine phosphoribosyltransferase